jgi:hypothetical protein
MEMWLEGRGRLAPARRIGPIRANPTEVERWVWAVERPRLEWRSGRAKPAVMSVGFGNSTPGRLGGDGISALSSIILRLPK